jgi:hypothetical protein
MKRIYVFLGVWLLSLGQAEAQFYPVLWKKCYGGSGNEGASHGISTFDGNIMLAGSATSNDGDVSGNKGSSDMWIVKLDSSGNLLWQKCFGGSQGDGATYILQTPDSGYIITGSTYSNDGDVSGNHGNGDLWLIEIDGNGNLLRQKCFGGTGQEGGTRLQYDLDGSLLVTGYTNSQDGDVTINILPGSSNAWVLKLDSLWDIQRQFGYFTGFGYNSRQNSALFQLPDGNFIANASSGTLINLTNFELLKFDSLGNPYLSSSSGGSDFDVCYDMDTISSTEYLLVGDTRSNDGDVSGNHAFPFSNTNDLWIIKVNRWGILTEQKCLGGGWWEEGHRVKVVSGNEFIVLGVSTGCSRNGDLAGLPCYGGNDYWFLVLDSTFSIRQQMRLGGSGEDIPTSIVRMPNGDIYLLGWTDSNNGDVSGNHGSADSWVIKLRHPTEYEASLELLPVTGNCTLSDSQQVVARVYNLGYSTFTNFPVSYSVNGGGIVTEIIQDSILPGDTLIYTFQTPADFSIPGIYTLESYVALTGDSCATNDTSTIDVTSIEVLHVPVSMGFEAHEDFSAWKQQDLDGDGFVGLRASLPHTGVYSYSVFRFMTIPTDNLLWTSCLSLIPVTNYFASCWIQEFDSLYPFYLEIYLNTQPDTNGALQLLNTVRASDNIFTQVAIPFNVPQPGNYYIGFRAIAHDSVLTSGAGLFLDDITIDINTSISSAHPSPNIFIHPNPFQHSIHISSTAVLNGNIRIFNALGAVVSTHPVKEILSMDLSHLSEGIYFVEYRDEQRSVVRKITKVN